MAASEIENDREELLKVLAGRVSGLTIAEMRQVARKWGWPLRGTARADLISQLLAYLSDGPRMRAAYEQLPEAEREILAWLPVMAGKGNERVLAAALEFASGRQLNAEDVPRLLSDLQARLMVFGDAARGWYLPGIYLEWIPELSAPGLAWHGDASPVAIPQIAELVEEAANLLAAIASDRPKGTGGETAGVKAVPGSTPEVAARPGPLPSDVLHSWGYTDPAERGRANFLVALLLAGGLCKLDLQSRRISVVQKNVDAWEAAGLQERYVQLRQWYVESVEGRLPWNELDMALPRIEEHRIPLTQSWYYGFNQFEQNLSVMRKFLLGLIQVLQRDRWYSLDRFGELLYRTQRDLFAVRPSQYGFQIQWYRGRVAQDAAHMSQATWRQTYGVVLETMLSGPAAWLGFTQVARSGASTVAFRRPILALNESAPIPADAARFQGNEIVLRNVWQVASLRPLLNHIAVVAGRNRTTTTYRLDARCFRDALRKGANADTIADSFAAVGFRLPDAVAAHLRDWQARAGRYQLYDNVAVIEVADDLAVSEIQAATVLGRSNVYAAGPRCLVVLEPDTIPDVLDDLVRKGYTPRVVHSEEAIES